jgi:hypothetical protein
VEDPKEKREMEKSHRQEEELVESKKEAGHPWAYRVEPK